MTFSIYQENIQQLTLDSAVQNVEIKGRDLENLFSDAGIFLKMGDDQRLVFFLESNDETYQVAKEILDIFQLYRSSLDNQRLVTNVYILGMNGRCISERRGFYQKPPGFLKDEMYLKKIMDNPDGVTILSPHVVEYDKGDDTTIAVSMGTVLYNRITMKPAGAIVVDMDVAEVKRLYADYRFFDIGRIDLVYGEEIPLSVNHADPKRWSQLMADHSSDMVYTFMRNGEHHDLFVKYRTSFSDLNILGHIFVDDLYYDVRRARNYFLLILLISAFLIYVIYYIISYGLMKPVEEIQTSMKKAALGELTVSHHYHWSFIPDLSERFNRMMRDLRLYIQKTDEEHRKYIDAELRAYQAQINPHFLYNTLDTILWSAVDQGNKEIEDLVYDMSQFFRISLSKGAEFITVREEIECIHSYLKIQKIRYASILDFFIEVDEDILEERMLKLLLQPVVENALYHGLKNKRERGTLRISGKRDDELLMFTVEDSGIGIPADKLDELNLQLARPEDYNNSAETGVGILNVQSRIKIKYGEPYGMVIKSVPGEGTVVTLVVPIPEA